MSAEVEPEALYTEGPLVHEFPRTVSRLREMRSAEFLAWRGGRSILRSHDPLHRTLARRGSRCSRCARPPLSRRRRRRVAPRRRARAHRDERAEAEAQYAQRERECRERFIVTSCIDDAKRSAARGRRAEARASSRRRSRASRAHRRASRRARRKGGRGCRSVSASAPPARRGASSGRAARRAAAQARAASRQAPSGFRASAGRRDRPGKARRARRAWA